jgi:hypothetical protein
MWHSVIFWMRENKTMSDFDIHVETFTTFEEMD